MNVAALKHRDAAARDGERGAGACPRPAPSLPSLERYRRHHRNTVAWLVRSVAAGGGGSCAYYSPLRGWSRPYPETTGYLVPTLLEAHADFGDLGAEAAALRAGEWLLGIQRPDGAWNGGLHPPRNGAQGSVFNTGQILKGMVALHRHTGEGRWLEAARRGAAWLVAGLGDDGLRPGRDYRAWGTPSYYTHVLWPMLEVWKETGDAALRAAAGGALERIVARRRPNGAFAGWAFNEDVPAFTHTIAYMLRGVQECARLLGEVERYHAEVAPALEVLTRRAELAGGNLPGAFDEAWRPRGRYVCLTGNAQLAICLLIHEAHAPDLRLVNAAARLVDRVCNAQRLGSRVPAGLRGAVAGSWPVWGAYMRLRYPNWAAKYLADALRRLSARVVRELEGAPCASS